MGLEQRIHLRAAQGIGVFRFDPRQRGLPDRARPVRGQGRQVIRHILPVAGDQHLSVRRKELLDPLPGVGDQAGGCARRLEDAGGG